MRACVSTGCNSENFFYGGKDDYVNVADGDLMLHHHYTTYVLPLNNR